LHRPHRIRFGAKLIVHEMEDALPGKGSSSGKIAPDWSLRGTEAVLSLIARFQYGTTDCQTN